VTSAELLALLVGVALGGRLGWALGEHLAVWAVGGF
jgi:hypothetical protein